MLAMNMNIWWQFVVKAKISKFLITLHLVYPYGKKEAI